MRKGIYLQATFQVPDAPSGVSSALESTGPAPAAAVQPALHDTLVGTHDGLNIRITKVRPVVGQPPGTVQAILYVEGDQAAPDDFAKLTTDAVRKLWQSAPAPTAGGAPVHLTGLTDLDGYDPDEDTDPTAPASAPVASQVGTGLPDATPATVEAQVGTGLPATALSSTDTPAPETPAAHPDAQPAPTISTPAPDVAPPAYDHATPPDAPVPTHPTAEVAPAAPEATPPPAPTVEHASAAAPDVAPPTHPTAEIAPAAPEAAPPAHPTTAAAASTPAAAPPPHSAPNEAAPPAPAEATTRSGRHTRSAKKRRPPPHGKGGR